LSFAVKNLLYNSTLLSKCC